MIARSWNESAWFRAGRVDFLVPESFPAHAIDVQVVDGQPHVHKWEPEDSQAWDSLWRDLPLHSIGWIGHYLDEHSWFQDDEMEKARLVQERERLTPDFSSIEVYGPLNHPNLHRIFASASSFAFPQQYGPIGPLFKLLDQEGDAYWAEIEAVWLHWQHQVKWLIDLWDTLRDRSSDGRSALEAMITVDGDRAALRRPPGLFHSWIEDWHPYAVTRALPQLHLSTTLVSPPSDPARLIRFAAFALLEANLTHLIRQDCSYTISLRKGRTVSLVPKNLRGAIYMSLLREITGEAPSTNQCPACGKVFIPEHGRQKYCSTACNQRAYHRRKKSKETER